VLLRVREQEVDEGGDGGVDGVGGLGAVEDLDALAGGAGVGDGGEVVGADPLEGVDPLVALGGLALGVLAAERDLGAAP